MSAARFRSSEVTRAIRAARAAGVETFDVVIGQDGMPIVKVRPDGANDHARDVDAEIAAWANDQNDAA